MAEALQFKDLKTNIDRLIASRDSFVVIGLGGNMGNAIEIIENTIERKGLSCRVYTSKRIAAAGGTLFGGITGLAGLASVVGIAAHNLATYNPDYEIEKHIVDNRLTIEYKKDG
jgi:hypothetical protein